MLCEECRNTRQHNVPNPSGILQNMKVHVSRRNEYARNAIFLQPCRHCRLKVQQIDDVICVSCSHLWSKCTMCCKSFSKNDS